MSQDITKPRHTICHPATAVMLWLFFMVWVMWVDSAVLLGISAGILLLFNQPARSQFIRYVRRSRWLLVVLLLMHAYSLPGAPLWPAFAGYVPSDAGVYSGMLQSWRLLLILAMLAVVLTRLSREALLAGIYVLLAPLRYVGLPSERIAMRIWLTLRYAEFLLQEAQSVSFKQRLLQLSSTPPVSDDMMQPLLLPVYRSSWVDYALLISMPLLGMWVR